MEFQIIGQDNFIYGLFPTKTCANLALKGMSAMLDGIRVEKIKKN